jgi:hypothetical protein
MLAGALLKLKISLLSNHPKRQRRLSFCAERITVDAREKD